MRAVFANWHILYFGGGWHKYFWFGIFVKFGIILAYFWTNNFFTICYAKCWTKFLPKFPTLLWLETFMKLLNQPVCIVFTNNRVSEDVRHIIKAWKWSKNAGKIIFLCTKARRTRYSTAQILHCIISQQNMSWLYFLLWDFVPFCNIQVYSSVFWIFVVIMLNKNRL